MFYSPDISYLFSEHLPLIVAAVAGGLALTGLIAGLLVSAGLNRLLESLLFGVGSLDVQSQLLVLVVLLGSSMLAVAIPAIRATRVDPIVALRDE